MASGMVYGITHRDLALGAMTAVGVPISLGLVAKGAALERSGAPPSETPPPRGARRWLIVLMGLGMLFLFNLLGAIDPDPSTALVVVAEIAGFAAGVAYVLRARWWHAA